MSDLNKQLAEIEQQNKKAKRIGFMKRCAAAIAFGWMVGGYASGELVVCSIGDTLFMFVYYQDDTVFTAMTGPVLRPPHTKP